MGSENNDPPGFRYWVAICEEYESAGEEGFDTADDLFIQYGISKEDVCGYAIFGFSTQDWLNFELELNGAAAYTKELRVQNKFYMQQLQDQYNIVMKNNENIRKQLENKK